MSQSKFPQLQASSAYCSKSKKERHRSHPYTIHIPQLAAPSSPLLQHHGTGIIEPSIAELVTELASLMLAPSNNIEAGKQTQHCRSHYPPCQHRQQIDQTPLQQQQQQHHHLYRAMHQNVSGIHTWQGLLY